MFYWYGYILELRVVIDGYDCNSISFDSFVYCFMFGFISYGYS